MFWFASLPPSAKARPVPRRLGMLLYRVDGGSVFIHYVTVPLTPGSYVLVSVAVCVCACVCALSTFPAELLGAKRPRERFYFP